MLRQNSPNHSLSWFISQIEGLQNQIPTVNFSDVDFLRKANFLMNEVTQIDISYYFPSYQNVDNYSASQMMQHIKKEAERIRNLLRRIALVTAVQSEDGSLPEIILISLQSLNVSLLQLNKELGSDYYLPLFSFTQSNTNK